MNALPTPPAALPEAPPLPPPGTRMRRGSALIVVLWVIGIMALLVSSFAFDAHLEAKITSYYRKRSRAVYLANSGLEIAKLLMAKSATIDPRADVPAEAADDKWYADARSLGAGGAIHRTYPLGDGMVDLQIVTEMARRNVNTLKDEKDWEPILDAIGVPQDLWPNLIEAFLDWTDADDEARADGAETTDYYASREPPYRARNGDLYSVEELLLIKGFNRAILEGGPLTVDDADKPVMIDPGGLSRLLTVFGDKKINVNAASYDVLMTLPSLRGDADLTAEAIISERAATIGPDGASVDNFFRDEADVFRRVPQLGEPERRDYISTAASTFFRITARGRVQNVEHKVSCIVQNTGGQLKYLRWIEDQ